MKRASAVGRILAILAVFSTLAITLSAQATAPAPPISSEDLKKYSGLINELGKIGEKLQKRIEPPAVRTQSRLLPLLPANTVFYFALPNYGETVHQTFAVFQEELKENAELRSWYEKDPTLGPKVQKAVEQFYQLSQYLGDEVVISGTLDANKEPNILVLAEVRKPGLQDLLAQVVHDYSEKNKPTVRVLAPADLATAKDSAAAKDQPAILVRPDLVVGAVNVAALRKFNARIETGSQEFAATGLGQRLAQSYQGGVITVAAADLHALLGLIPQTPEQSQVMLRSTGFSDLKYAVWEFKTQNGEHDSQLEVSFSGPRRSIASWLAAPGPLGAIDFFSPKAIFATSIRLKNPAEIFDDIKSIAAAANPNAPDSIAQAQESLRLNFREDLFAHLGGEIALEFDNVAPPAPVWKVFLKAKDPTALMATLHTLFGAGRLTPTETDIDGVTYHTIPIPGPKPQEIGFAVVDNYLIIGSSLDAVTEAVRLHRTGESLAKSAKFLARLPAGDLSAVFYEEPVAFATMGLRQSSPELAEMLSKLGSSPAAVVMAGYGDETAVREVTRTPSTNINISGMLIVAAIAIPNLLRARMAANESSAVASLRSVNTAQVTYAVAFPQKGYARDLAMLGPDPGGTNASTPQHASFLDASLAGATCTSSTWCVKSGYQFRVALTCKQQPCRGFVAVATPVNTNSGTRSFCSTSDTVIRYKTGESLTEMITATQCRTWEPLR